MAKAKSRNEIRVTNLQDIPSKSPVFTSEDAKLSNDGQVIQKEIKQIDRFAKQSFWLIGQRLNKLKSFYMINGEYDEDLFLKFCDEELNYKRTMIFDLISVYKKLSFEQVAELPNEISKIILIASIEDDKKREVFIAAAKDNTSIAVLKVMKKEMTEKPESANQLEIEPAGEQEIEPENQLEIEPAGELDLKNTLPKYTIIFEDANEDDITYLFDGNIINRIDYKVEMINLVCDLLSSQADNQIFTCLSKIKNHSKKLMEAIKTFDKDNK